MPRRDDATSARAANYKRTHPKICLAALTVARRHSGTSAPVNPEVGKAQVGDMRASYPPLIDHGSQVCRQVHIVDAPFGVP